MRSRTPIVLVALLATVLASCGDTPEPPPPVLANGQVSATVASFRVTANPGGAVTVEQIAVANNLIRFPGETGRWRLFDIGGGTVTVVDEINRQVERTTFDEVLDGLRSASRQASIVPAAVVRRTGEVETIADFEAERFLVAIEQGYERELWISRRPLFHSDLFLLRLATDSIPVENLPALGRVISLIDQSGGYPVLDRSGMVLDGQEYTIERSLITVTDQQVPASWFELPSWARAVLTEPRGDRPPDASPRAGRNTPAEESRPSGSDRTDP